MFLLVCAVLAGWILPSASWAGAWVQPVGGIYLKGSVLHQRSESRLDSKGQEESADPSGGAYVETQIFGYLEWGWTSRTTVLGSWAAKDMRVEAEPEFGTRSTGDLRLGMRQALQQGPTALALEGVLTLPTYPASDLSRAPGDREQALPAGTGRVAGELRLVAGRSLFPLPLYLNLDVGYRVRGGGYPDQWQAAFELGGSGRDLFAKGELRGLWDNGRLDSDLQVGAVALSERSLRAAGEVAWRVAGPFWIDGGVVVPWTGRNTLLGAQWSISLVYQEKAQ